MELAQMLKTDKARRAYADDDKNWEIEGARLFGSVLVQQLKGFRIYRVRGWCKGFCEDYPDHHATLYTFEVSPEGYVTIDDLRSPAKISATMKKQMEERKEEGKCK